MKCRVPACDGPRRPPRPASRAKPPAITNQMRPCQAGTGTRAFNPTENCFAKIAPSNKAEPKTRQRMLPHMLTPTYRATQVVAHENDTDQPPPKPPPAP